MTLWYGLGNAEVVDVDDQNFGDGFFTHAVGVAASTDEFIANVGEVLAAGGYRPVELDDVAELTRSQLRKRYFRDLRHRALHGEKVALGNRHFYPLGTEEDDD